MKQVSFKQGNTKCFIHLIVNTCCRYHLTKCSKLFADPGKVI